MGLLDFITKPFSPYTAQQDSTILPPKGQKLIPPEGWPKGWDYTQTMHDYVQVLRFHENSTNTGLKNDKWYAYDSVEGGEQTIAYGHKLDPGESYPQGLSDAEAEEMLLSDLAEAMVIAHNKYQNVGFSWNDISDHDKILLTELAFNKGGASPQFMKAVSINDKAEMSDLMRQRGYIDPGTNKVVLLQNRNKAMIDNYIY